MRILKAIVYGLLLGGLVSCAIVLNDLKLTPEYTGVDHDIAPYVNEWLELAKMDGLKFHNTVTIGFKDINQGNVIGICYYGMSFREIDIDRGYWRISSSMSKMALVYHELSHCYCDRDHDYGAGKLYGDGMEATKDPNKRDGFFGDGCPKSLMFPVAAGDYCTLMHYQDYINEMFERCDEY